MRNKNTFSLSLLLSLVVMMAACGPKPADTVGETPEVTESPSGSQAQDTPVSPSGDAWLLDRDVILDPALQTDEDALAVCGLLYNGLVILDAVGNPAPSLAAKWTVSEDELDYIFELRPNVTFASGAPFNADAVLANFNRWFDPASPLRGEGGYAGWLEYFLGFKGELDASGVPVSQFDGIEKVNDLTVLIHLNRLEPNLLAYLAQPYFYMVDPGALAAEGAAYGIQPGSVSGTGAYILAARDDNGMTFLPSPIHWGEAAAEDITVGWR